MGGTVFSLESMATICERLRSAEVDSCTRFVWTEVTTFARVVRIVDGDTLQVLLFVRETDPHPVRHIVRLADIDAPEPRSRNGEERRAAQNAKKATSRLCEGRIVRLHIQGIDRYGRLVAHVYVAMQPQSCLCINQWLLEHNLVWPYRGVKRDLATDVAFQDLPMPETVDIT